MSTSPDSLWRRVWQRHETSLLVAIALVALLTTLLDSQHNYWTNWRGSAIDLVRQWSMLGLFSLGAAVVIIAGGIDLSAGSVIAFGGTICATLLLILAPQQMLGNQPLPLWAMAGAIAGTLLAGFFVGSLHAWLITRVGLPPFVATLATLVGLRSLARAICEQATLSIAGSKSTQIQIFDPTFRYLATSVWIPAVVCFAIGVALWVFMSGTATGRHLYALGGNEQAARLSGVQTDRLKWLAYALSAVLSSIAGVVYIGEQSVADPQTLGRGYELNAIAASVVGGCSLQGGVGTIPGALLGSLFLRFVIDGVSKIIKTGADVYEGLIVGVVVVLAVTFTQMSQRNRRQSSLFSDSLGAVTVANLSLLAAVLGALVGPRFLSSKSSLDEFWLAVLAGGGSLALLYLMRVVANPKALRVATGASLLMTVLAGVGLESLLPNVRQAAAMSALKAAGGSLTQAEDGSLIANLQNTSVNDAEFRKLAATLSRVRSLSELRLNDSSVTDASIDAFKLLPQLRRCDLTGTQFTPGGKLRLRRAAPNLQLAD